MVNPLVNLLLLKELDKMIFPYLFVIYIERLSHLIQLVVSQNLWMPIFLSNEGLVLTHLCFADNLFIFTKALMNQVEVINRFHKTFV